MADLTLVYMTNSKLPDKWVRHHKKVLLDAAGNYPIISFSRTPIDIGENHLQTEPESKRNIFYQILKGVRLAKTKYIATVEDDVLYHNSHFEMRSNKILYNVNKWSLYTWNPVYNLKNWIRTQATMIAPRELVLEILEKRFKKEITDQTIGEIGVFDGIKVEEFKSHVPIIQLDHDFFTPFDRERETIKRRHKKELGSMQALDIPYWGKSQDLIKYFL